MRSAAKLLPALVGMITVAACRTDGAGREGVEAGGQPDGPDGATPDLRDDRGPSPAPLDGALGDATALPDAAPGDSWDRAPDPRPEGGVVEVAPDQPGLEVGVGAGEGGVGSGDVRAEAGGDARPDGGCTFDPHRTRSHPEVGRFERADGTWCSATLIDDDHVLTAGHCVGYANSVLADDRFVFHDKANIRRAIPVERIHTFGGLRATAPDDSIVWQWTPDGFGTNDLALLRLTVAVSASWATPARIGLLAPVVGEEVKLVGHGCNACAEGPNKQEIPIRIGEPLVARCPGSAGGALLMAGALVGVKSVPTAAPDTYASVVWFRERILAVMSRWDQTGVPGAVAGVDQEGLLLFDRELPSPDPKLCDADCRERAGCRGWSYVEPGLRGLRARCTLRSAVAPWVPYSGSVTRPHMADEPGYSRPGADLKEVRIGFPRWQVAPRSELCKVECAELPGCAAYTYLDLAPERPRCLLKSDVPAPVADPQAVSGVFRGFELDVDRPGHDLQEAGVALSQERASLCADLCAKDERCRAFSYAPAGGTHGPVARCWLKRGSPPPVAAPTSGRVSAVKRGLDLDTDREGPDIMSFQPDAEVPEACQAACARHETCGSWSFSPSGKEGAFARCHLRGASAAPSSAEGMVSGVRGFEYF